MSTQSIDELVTWLQNARRDLETARERIKQADEDVAQLTLMLKSPAAHDFTIKDGTLTFPKMTPAGVPIPSFTNVTISLDLIDRIFSDLELMRTATSEIEEIRGIAQERGIDDVLHTSLPGETE